MEFLQASLLHYVRGSGLSRTTQQTQAAGVWTVRIPGTQCLRLVYLPMIKNSIRRKEKRQREQEQKREAAKWLSGLVDVHAVAADGTERILEGEEAIQAIIRHWEADEGK